MSSALSILDFNQTMGLPNLLMWPAIIFAILLIIFLILVFQTRTPGIQDYMPSMTSLAEATFPLSSQQANQILLTGPGCTLAGLFNVTIGDRTNQLATPATSNFTTLFGSVGSIEFQLAPASVSSHSSTAQLLIGTQAGKSEAIPLPPLPAQKWVFIAILRDGRRFDVLYNDSIVASHRLEAFPATSVQNQLQVGSKPSTPAAAPRFLGNAIHLFAVNYRMTPADLAILRARHVDTTGAPPTSLPFPFPINLPSLQSLCIPGLPCSPVNQPPPNALQAWSSPYA
jgi:hypothetical protein